MKIQRTPANCLSLSHWWIRAFLFFISFSVSHYFPSLFNGNVTSQPIRLEVILWLNVRYFTRSSKVCADRNQSDGRRDQSDTTTHTILISMNIIIITFIGVREKVFCRGRIAEIGSCDFFYLRNAIVLCVFAEWNDSVEWHLTVAVRIAPFTHVQCDCGI